MVHHESWKCIYFEVKRLNVKVTWPKKHAYVSLQTVFVFSFSLFFLRFCAVR